MRRCLLACCLVAAVGLISLLTSALVLGASLPVAGLLALDSPIEQPGRVLIVIAHPDDETIFFSPTISALRSAGQEVYLLCFTNGDAHGLGNLRAQELEAAAAALQVEASHLIIINNDRIQDGHHTIWDAGEVTNVLEQHVNQLQISTVITFDGKGVYGHKNHIACYDAVRQYLQRCNSQGWSIAGRCPRAYQLLTTSQLRKYSSIFDMLPSVIEGHLHRTNTYINRSLLRTLMAMAHHHTQMRWWRHVLMTRYTFVNTLKPILADTVFRETASGEPVPLRHVWHKARIARALRMGMGPAELGITFSVNGYALSSVSEQLQDRTVLGFSKLTDSQATAAEGSSPSKSQDQTQVLKRALKLRSGPHPFGMRSVGPQQEAVASTE